MGELKRRHFLSGLAASASGSAPSLVHAKVNAPKTFALKDDGIFPNSRLPALLYTAVQSPGADLASRFERLFEQHGWTGSWRNGLFRFHHYHSTAHEVLGVYSGTVRVRLGGAGGQLVTLKAGDVVVVPAGVAHKNESQSSDFRVVGAYPSGTSADMQYGKPNERPTTDRNVAAVPLPRQDPVAGKGGPLRSLWRANTG